MFNFGSRGKIKQELQLDFIFEFCVGRQSFSIYQDYSLSLCLAWVTFYRNKINNSSGCGVGKLFNKKNFIIFLI